MIERKAIGERLRALRIARCGESGSRTFARELHVPDRSWANYERGTAISGEVLLRVMILTGVSPQWLYDGTGPMFAAISVPSSNGTDPDPRG